MLAKSLLPLCRILYLRSDDNFSYFPDLFQRIKNPVRHHITGGRQRMANTERGILVSRPMDRESGLAADNVRNSRLKSVSCSRHRN